MDEQLEYICGVCHKVGKTRDAGKLPSGWWLLGASKTPVFEDGPWDSMPVCGKCAESFLWTLFGESYFGIGEEG